MLIDEVSHYISFPVEIKPSIVYRENHSGVIVITLRDRDDSFYVENRVLVELKGE